MARPESEIERIREGFRWEEARKVQDAYELADGPFARLLGVSGRTLARVRKDRRPLDPVASDRLYRLRRILALAVALFETREAAVRWLGSSQLGLAGGVPVELLDTEPGAAAVETLLKQLELGVLP